MSEGWKNLDAAAVQAARKRQNENATTSANAGGYVVPLGGPMRPAVAKPIVKKKKR